MKKTLCFLFSLLAILFALSACTNNSEDPYTYSLVYNSKEIHLTVDPQNGTITDGKDIYHYTISGENNITITYPNGATYWSGGDAAGWSNDYDSHNYIRGFTLENALEQQLKSSTPSIGIWAPLLLLGIGLLSVLYPELIWQLSHGWAYKNAEPSNFALIGARVSGALMILLGVILLFLR